MMQKRNGMLEKWGKKEKHKEKKEIVQKDWKSKNKRVSDEEKHFSHQCWGSNSWLPCTPTRRLSYCGCGGWAVSHFRTR